jgi:2-polyprenyl-3-methyl-5-hydroxy-6-metoxy-1,4-benzoquinol methylase
MQSDLLRSIKSSYGPKSSAADVTEVSLRKLREAAVGIDYSIFDKTIRYYEETKGQRISRQEAASKALNKAEHKHTWFKYDRKTPEQKMRFYEEVHVYPFRQPYNKRFGGFRWYRHLVSHAKEPSILEYGCGSAVLSEYLIDKFPRLRLSVADIPSVTLDFVKWKKTTYGYPYNVLTIAPGKEGIPLSGRYDLIVCEDVLEHTCRATVILTPSRH